MKSPHQGLVDVEGGRIWYEIVGEGDRTPLIALHGGPGVSHEYLEPLAALGDERRIVFYDQLGAGRSDRPHDDALWNAARFERELAALRGALGLERAHILGQSWGTMLAVDHALSGGAGIESLVLSSPCLSVSRWRDDAEVLIAAMPDADRAAIVLARASGNFDSPAYHAAAFAFSKRHLCRLDPWPALMLGSAGSVNRHVYSAVWGPTDFEATGDLRDYERAEDLHRLSMPVLYLCGRYDGATPGATAWYQSLTPNAEMVVFEESSHLPHIEEAELFLGVVRDFLRRADARTGARGVIADVEVREAGTKGKGVFARRAFATGEFIFRRRHGRVVDSAGIATLSTEEQMHMCESGWDRFAVLVPPGCYLNHSCEPSAMRSGVKVFAWRSIAAGEEITIDYRLNAFDGSSWPCDCGTQACSGTVVGSFFALPAERQRAYLRYAPEFIRREYRKRQRDAAGQR